MCSLLKRTTDDGPQSFLIQKALNRSNNEISIKVFDLKLSGPWSVVRGPLFDVAIL